MPKITSFHPDGTKFLPEKFTIPADSEQGLRIYKLIAEIVNAVASASRSEHNKEQITLPPR